MDIRDAIKHSTGKLKHLRTPLLDAEVLLSFVLHNPREYVLAHPEEEVSADNAARFEDLIKRRANHEPVAYLIQNKEFYGRNFYVDNRAHIPRPATEDLIDAIKDALHKNFDKTIADIGTGSGCIAVTLALEFPHAKIIATDISEDALAVAQRNADALNVKDRITFLKGDLLSPLSKPADIIIANLPYGWKEFWTDSKEVFFQPRASYNGGKDGLELIKKLITDLPAYIKQNGQCFLEFDPRQKDSIMQLAKDNKFNISIKKDLANFDRVAVLSFDS